MPSCKTKLQDYNVVAFEPLNGKPTILWDTGIIGFCCKVSADGNNRSFLYKYRVKRTGRVRWMTIGRFGKVDTNQARSRARKVQAEVELGGDPMAAQDDAKAKLNVREAWAIYLENHIRLKRKPKTADDYERLGRLYILPALGSLKMEAVQHRDVARLQRKAQVGGRNRTANYVLSVLSSFFNWCIRNELTKAENVAEGMDRFPESRRERYLSEAEYDRLSAVLVEADKTENRFALAAIRMLILTGARKNEILKARWDWLDRDQMLLNLPDSKTGSRKIVLTQAEMAILESLPRDAANPFIFQGHVSGRPFVGMAKFWQRIRKRAGLEDVRLHDLRHSFAAVAAGGGMSLPQIGKLLGHTQAQTTQRYAHIGQSPERAAKERVSNALARRMSMGGNAGGFERSDAPVSEIVEND